MREPNFSFPTQNKAAIVISSTLYDRRALDCTATLPLVNSLTHLAYMTSTSPRLREILASDGGLERLVKILATCHNTDKHSLWKWSLAFQCVVNIGVRGTEATRTRVVQVGAVHVVVAILENFLKALEQAKLEKEQERHQQQQQQQQQQPLEQHVVSSSNGNNTSITALSLTTMPLPPQSRSTPVTASRRLFSTYSSSPNTNDPATTESNLSNTNLFSTSSLATTSAPNSNNTPYVHAPSAFSIPKRRTFLSGVTAASSTKSTSSSRTKTPSPTATHSSIPLLNSLTSEAVLHREEDILLSLQLLAYLSKYPHLRQTFHNDHRHNVFSVVEKFTHRIHPQTVIYWAGVIMRNACRKDESQGGIRQCAYMHCGKWEKYPREFAKCRRCRKAKYCSKTCQSRAWGEGHRWWCVERTHSSHPPPTTDTTAAATQAATTTTQAPTEVVTDTPSTTQAGDNMDTGNEEDTPDPPSQQQPDPSGLRDQQDPPHQGPSDHQALLFYHRRRRNSRSAQSLTSGSSTEIELDTTLPPAQQDLMEID